MEVKYLDLKKQYESIKEEIQTSIQQVMDNTSFILGKAVTEFEENFAKYCGVDQCIAVNSGTSAITLALIAAGIEKGNRVIIPANTFIATAFAVTHAGGIPVFCDVDAFTFNINPYDLEAKLVAWEDLGYKIKFVIPVHLHGYTADMPKILKLSERYNFKIIEDACQAHGAISHNNIKAGASGLLGCFSFYPGKNLGAYGEGGAIVTNDLTLSCTLRMLRDQGSAVKYHHPIIGYNCRMDGLQGAVLNVKLKHLDDWNKKRSEIADLYREHLQGNDYFTLPAGQGEGWHVYHVFALVCCDPIHRDALQKFLKESGIQTLIHYPIPIPSQEAYRSNTGENFPVSEALAGTMLSLPMYPDLEEEEVHYVCDKIKEFFDAKI